MIYGLYGLVYWALSTRLMLGRLLICFFAVNSSYCFHLQFDSPIVTRLNCFDVNLIFSTISGFCQIVTLLERIWFSFGFVCYSRPKLNLNRIQVSVEGVLIVCTGSKYSGSTFSVQGCIFEGA